MKANGMASGLMGLLWGRTEVQGRGRSAEPRARVLHTSGSQTGAGAAGAWSAHSSHPLGQSFWSVPQQPFSLHLCPAQRGGARKCIWQAPASSVHANRETQHAHSDSMTLERSPQLPGPVLPWQRVRATEGKTLVELLRVSSTRGSPRSPWERIFDQVACMNCVREKHRGVKRFGWTLIEF